MADDKKSAAGRELARRGASAGGIARARSLTPEDRSEIARGGALARWGSDLVPATHDGSLLIGEGEIRCAVLADGTRVLTQETVLTSIGRARKAKGGAGGLSGGLPAFLAAANLEPYISDELREKIGPILYRTKTGGRAIGYRAETLPMVCDVYLDAREAKTLLKNQEPIAQTCELLVRGLARIGIIALVDEATGYQEERARNELQKIINLYVHPELRPWTKTFPDEFFEAIYRLQGWEYRPGSAKRIPYVGKLINKYIYDPLPPGVLDRLRELNPRVTPGGHRRRRHFQYLTADTGVPQLDKQITSVMTLMRIARDNSEFQDLFERAFPPPQMRLPLRIDQEEAQDETN